MMPPMKYWELIADKLNSNGLVVRAIAARLRGMAGARSGRAHKKRRPPVHRRVWRAAKRVSGVGATLLWLPALSSSSDLFLRSIGNFLPRQLTA